jgi:CheY-like chemotaxis protein
MQDTVIKKLTICVIDDDEVSQFILARSVKSHEAVKNTLIFPDGTPAIKFLLDNLEQEEQLPDVIFLDINMPLMNGWRFLEEFANVSAKLKKSISIYMVSSSENPEDIARAMRMDAISDYLIKPVKLELMDCIINRLSA